MRSPTPNDGQYAACSDFEAPTSFTLMTAADAAPFTVTLAVLGTSTALLMRLAPPQVLTALQAPSAAAEILQEHSIGVNMVIRSSANEHSPPLSP